MFSFVVACTSENIIGKNNSLPWKISEDLKLFKELTINKTIIMGRKTFDSINRSLPNRKIIVLTRDPNYKLNFENVDVTCDFETLIKKYYKTPEEIAIVGGAEIYKMFLPYCSIIHISWIKKNYAGDIYFPYIDWNNFIITEEKKYNEFTYKKYVKKTKE